MLSQLQAVLDRAHQGHLVCSVAGHILDNRHRWVMRRDDLPYTWLSAGAADGTWRRIIA
ncbi:hypothetical protein ACYCFK_16370 [Stutzerimonas stutzeri]